jgi:hypothetical protein
VYGTALTECTLLRILYALVLIYFSKFAFRVACICRFCVAGQPLRACSGQYYISLHSPTDKHCIPSCFNFFVAYFNVNFYCIPPPSMCLSCSSCPTRSCCLSIVILLTVETSKKNNLKKGTKLWKIPKKLLKQKIQKNLNKSQKKLFIFYSLSIVFCTYFSLQIIKNVNLKLTTKKLLIVFVSIEVPWNGFQNYSQTIVVRLWMRCLVQIPVPPAVTEGQESLKCQIYLFCININKCTLPRTSEGPENVFYLLYAQNLSSVGVLGGTVLRD